jgi:beta-lactam-binding protein with PASTA domain
VDFEQNAIIVPSFAGKSVRAAIEMAQENGLDLNAVGSGLARDQSPLAGAHVPSGSKVMVRFGR